MSSQAGVGAERSDGAESAGGLSCAAHGWLTQRWPGEAAGPSGQGIELADGVDGSAIVRMRGDLDLCSSSELRSVLAGLLDTHRPTSLDLSAIRFIDCHGLGVVLWAAGAARAEGWSFIVAAVRAPCVIRLSALAGVGAVLPAYAATDRSQDLRRSVL
ncbi:MAG: STAS domain-containing protein [Baekduia sp.]